MTDAPTWRPHATWVGFAPGPDGSLPSLEPKRVLEALDALADVPVGTLRLTGVEHGDDRSLVALFRHAARAGITVEVQIERPICRRRLDALAEAFLVSVPLEGPDAATHDSYRRAPGEFDQVACLVESIVAVGLQPEIRTNLRKGFEGRLSSMLRMVEAWSAASWVVEVPTSSGTPEVPIERSLAVLAEKTHTASLSVATRYAPFFLRLCGSRASRCSVHTERNGICISASGAVTPDPSIPLRIGDVRADRLVDVFDDHPLLRALRDPDAIEGKCGRCEFRMMCGGSRARAWAHAGNLFASDPACSYEA